MRTRIGVWAVALGTAVLVGCGGTAESAEQPDRTDAAPNPEAVVESPAPEAPAAVASEAAPAAAPAAERTAPRTREARPTQPKPEPQPPTPEPAPAPAVVLTAGTAITLVVDQELSTKHNVAGDGFSAHVAEDVLAADGMVLIPAGAVVRGEVVESRASASSDDMPKLVLAVSSLETPDGDHPLVADVEEVQMEAEARDSDRNSAGKVAAGAAAGAILGKIAGKDTRATVTGAVVGAAAGAVVAGVTKAGNATVPQGAHMVIRVVQPVVLR